MTTSLIFHVFFIVLVSSFASALRGLERISAVVECSNSSVFGLERILELSLQISKAGYHALDIAVFNENTSPKVKNGTLLFNSANQIVTLESEDAILKWLSKNKPQIVLCFAEVAGMPYIIVNAKRKGMLSSVVRIILILEDVKKFLQKYDINKIETVLVHSDFIVFLTERDQRFLEKELLEKKLFKRQVDFGIVLQSFSLVKDLFMASKQKGDRRVDTFWKKEKRLRRAISSPNNIANSSNITTTTSQPPSLNDTGVEASTTVSSNEPAPSGVVLSPTVPSFGTSSPSFPSVPPSPTVASGTSLPPSTASVALSWTVTANNTSSLSSADVASSPTVATNETSVPPSSASVALSLKVTATSPPSSAGFTPSLTLAANGTSLPPSSATVAPSPTVAANGTSPPSSVSVASSPIIAANETSVPPSSASVGPSLKFTATSPPSSAGVTPSPTVAANGTSLPASSASVAPFRTVAANETSVPPSSASVAPSLTVSANGTSTSSVSVAISPTVTANRTSLPPSSPGVASSPTVAANGTSPTSSVSVAASLTPAVNATSPKRSSPGVGITPTLAANTTAPPTFSPGVTASPTVAGNSTSPQPSSTEVAPSSTVLVNGTSARPSSNLTVGVTNSAILKNRTVSIHQPPTASSNATVVAPPLTTSSQATIMHTSSSQNVSYSPSQSVFVYRTSSDTSEGTTSTTRIISESPSVSLSVMTTVSFRNQSVLQQTLQPSTAPSITLPFVTSNQSSSVEQALNKTFVVSASPTTAISTTVFSLPPVFSTMISSVRMSPTAVTQLTSSAKLSSFVSSTGLVYTTVNPTPATSSVQIVVNTPGISTASPPSKDDERYVITLEGNCNDVIGSEESKNKFKEEFKKTIADIARISENEIQIEELKCGSIDVVFNVKNAKSRNVTAFLSKTLSEGNMIINFDGKNYTFSELVVIPFPVPTTKTTHTPEPENKLALYLYISFAAVIGIIFSIGLIVLIVRCRRDKTTGAFTLGSEADVELKRFKGIPRASYYRVEMYGEAVDIDAARSGVRDDECDGDIVPYAQTTAFNPNSAIRSSANNNDNTEEFAMGNLPQWNIPKLNTSDVVVTSPKKYSAKNEKDIDDGYADNDTLHAYDNPVMTFGDTSTM